MVARLSRAHICAAIVGLTALGFGLGVAADPGNGASDHYRPDGLKLHQVRRGPSGAPRAAESCLRAGDPDRSNEVQAELGRLFAILAQSAAGRAVLHQARQRNVRVCLDERTHLLAYYFAGVRIVGVSTELSEAGKIVFLAHELAHVPQHPVYSDNRYFPPGDLILLRRAREAAAEAIATRIAWELRQGGYAPAWNEKMMTAYGDVARAFEQAARRDSTGAGMRGAMRAAFDRWFEAPWRRNVYDRMTVDHLDRISGDEIGLVAPRRHLSHARLAGIGWFGGRNFLSDTEGRRLTDRFYMGRVSARIARRLERIREAIMLAARPGVRSPVVDSGS